MTFEPGARLGPYEVNGLLGAGGMGEVYRARDSRLGRHVAIKVLPAGYAADADRLHRFEQEARAASALNHPNILAVYDVGTHEDVPYLVTELLEGESLRERLQRGPLALRKAVELALQVCSGLAAAHEKGIVHRDLKPENLFITRDGHARILDFGLAKLRPGLQDVASAPTALHSTEPGRVMGTVAYMSPEQVRGQVVDQRSDIFSLGAVLYEMVTGKPAFARGTPADTMSAILKEEPPEPASVTPATPLPLARAILHCLEKQAGERYQSVRDLAFDLQVLTDTHTGSAAAAGPAVPRTWRRVGLATAGLGIAAAFFVAGYVVAGRRAAARVESPSFKRLTFQRGTIGNARFAPDGRTVIYSAAWDGGAPEVLETRADLSTTRSLGLRGVSLLAVSRAGELALRKTTETIDIGSGRLAIVSSAGSAPREVLEKVSSADWSPDGQTLAVVTRVGGEYHLEMPPGRAIAKTSGWFGNIRVASDGRTIALTEHPNLQDDRGAVALVDAAGGRRTITKEFFGLTGLDWSPDGQEIWFSAGESGPRQSLFAVTPAGRLRLVAQFPSDIVLFDTAADGGVLLGSRTVQSGIRGRASGAEQERELGWLDFPWPMGLSPDGSTLLLNDVGETSGLTYTVYLRGMDGSPPIRLGPGLGRALSPDGQWALATRPGRPQQLVLIPTGPGDAITLPAGQIESYQDGEFVPDGRRVVFVGSERGRPQRTWVQECRGGLPEALTPEGTVGVRTSPDGKWVAAVTQDRDLELFPLQGGDPARVARLAAREQVRQWSKDGRTLFVSRGGAHLEVFLIDVRSGAKKPWRTFDVPDPAGVRIGEFFVTPDGRSYAYGYMRVLGDLYLAEGLK